MKVNCKFKRQVSLKKYSSIKIGGRARYFLEVKSLPQLKLAIQQAKQLNLPIFILGGGTNVLFKDQEFPGLILKIGFSGIEKNGNNLKVKAGTSMSRLVKFSLENKLSGLEWASGLPGTVGGAVYGNAGCFKKEIKDVVRKVKSLNLDDLSLVERDKSSCEFGYRSSIFKKNREVILELELELNPGNELEIQRQVKRNLNWRKAHQPLNYPSLGCIFKNPEDSSAGYLIEEAGLKGKRFGDARISFQHSNFIINLGKARFLDVNRLINLIKNKVKQKFGLSLQEEIIKV